MSVPCFVFIAAQDRNWSGLGPVKVGISRDPKRRLSKLQTAYRLRIFEICQVYTHDRVMALALEAGIRDDLAGYRNDNGWFDASPFVAIRSLLICYRELLEAAGFTERQFFEYAHAGSGIASVLETYHQVGLLLASPAGEA